MNDKLNELMLLKKMAKYGKHLPGMIHNLNTPLMGISGRVELIGFKMPELKGLDQIRTQLDAISDILNTFAQFLDKDNNENSSEINLADLIHRVDLFFKTNMTYKHKTTVTIDVPDIMLNTIVTYLQNAIAEIINNALEAMGEHGELIIKAEEDGDKIKLIIENNNSQIPQEVLDKLGEPFVGNKEGHLGLGFYTAIEYLKKINGELIIENIIDKVRVTIVLKKS